jgi:hypothetical protein
MPGLELVEEEVGAALRYAFANALVYLQSEVAAPDPNQEKLLSALISLDYAGRVGRPEDIAALSTIAQTARTLRGPGSQRTEEAALRALVELADESTLPFLIESYRFSRPHDGSSGHRRAIVLTGIVTIALLYGNAEAVALVEEALAHGTQRVRVATCRALEEVIRISGRGLPDSLTTQLEHIARHERGRDLRVNAQLALQAASEVATQP